MHIALVCRWYPPHSGFGGVAMHNYYAARALVKAGHRVSVIAARWSEDCAALEVAEGVTVRRLLSLHRSWMHRLPLYGRHARSFVQWSYSRRVAAALRNLERADPPDVIEFADIEAEGHAYLAGRPRRPVVIRCHTPAFVLHRYYRPEELPWRTEGIEAREKLCIGRANALTAPSARHGANHRRRVRPAGGADRGRPQRPGRRAVPGGRRAGGAGPRRRGGRHPPRRPAGPRQGRRSFGRGHTAGAGPGSHREIRVRGRRQVRRMWRDVAPV